MRLVFLSNFYPPQDVGGQEQICCEVADELIRRGHDVLVLTSTYGESRDHNEASHIRRVLHLESDLLRYDPWRFFTARRHEEKGNLTHLRNACDAFLPDLVFVWGTWNLPRSLFSLAETLLPGRVVYYFMGLCPTSPSHHEAYWRLPANHWYSRPLKNLVSRLALWVYGLEQSSPPRHEHAICVSDFIKQELIAAGLPLEEAPIIRHGTNLEEFLITDQEFDRKVGGWDRTLSLIYAGRLVADKGVHTAIEAMAILKSMNQLLDDTLTIVGSGSPDYVHFLRNLVQDYELGDVIRFCDWVPREAIPGVFREHDVFLFTSIYDEPLGRAPHEAMASGLVVVGTEVGGTGEYFNDGCNVLLYQAGNASDLAHKILRLKDDLCLRRSLAVGGRETVTTQFNISNTFDAVERYLCQILADAANTSEC